MNYLCGPSFFSRVILCYCLIGNDVLIDDFPPSLKCVDFYNAISAFTYINRRVYNSRCIEPTRTSLDGSADQFSMPNISFDLIHTEDFYSTLTEKIELVDQNSQIHRFKVG